MPRDRHSNSPADAFCTQHHGSARSCTLRGRVVYTIAWSWWRFSHWLSLKAGNFPPNQITITGNNPNNGIHVLQNINKAEPLQDKHCSFFSKLRMQEAMIHLLPWENIPASPHVTPQNFINFISPSIFKGLISHPCNTYIVEEHRRCWQHSFQQIGLARYNQYCDHHNFTDCQN